MSRPPWREIVHRGRRSPSRSPSPPRPPSLSYRLTRNYRTTWGRNRIRLDFFTSMPRNLPPDIMEMIWKRYLSDRSIPYFRLWFRRGG